LRAKIFVARVTTIFSIREVSHPKRPFNFHHPATRSKHPRKIICDLPRVSSPIREVVEDEPKSPVKVFNNCKIEAPKEKKSQSSKGFIP
jgi:hypothetical protein